MAAVHPRGALESWRKCANWLRTHAPEAITELARLTKESQERDSAHSAVSPWRIALQWGRCLPSLVVGPVLLRALRRLASICLKEVIAGQRQQLGSFR
jgi:hypothetical protein